MRATKLIFSAVLTFLVLGTNTSATISDSDDEAIYKLINIENQRLNNDPFLQEALTSNSEQVLVKVLWTLGNIADPAYVIDIRPFLNHESATVRKSASFALGLIGGQEARTLLTDTLTKETNSGVLAVQAKALGNIGDYDSVARLQGLLAAETDPALLASAAQGLGILFTFGVTDYTADAGFVSDLLVHAVKADPLGSAAAFALARVRTFTDAAAVEKIKQAFAAGESVYAKALLCRALAKIPSAESAQLLLDILAGDAGVNIRIEVMKALGKQETSPEILAAFAKVLANADEDQSLVVQTLNVIEQLGAKAASISAAVGQRVRSGPTWVRSEALRAFAAVDRAGAMDFLVAGLTDSVPFYAESAALALATGANEADTAKLVGILGAEQVYQRRNAVEALALVAKEHITPAIVAALADAIGKGDLAVLTYAAETAKAHELRELIAPIMETYDGFAADEIEGKVAVLGALEKLGSAEHAPLAEKALKDPVKQVVVAAAAAYKALTGTDVSERIPLNSRVTEVTPSEGRIDSALTKRVVLETSKGQIVLKMYADAPLTVANFISLVEAKFYDGKTFHRIVPNFVAQGGDPRGDGFGGPGYLIRDEYTPRVHKRGVVGIATAGKDTGGCQFFIDLAPNLHLDMHYTAFAEVESGMEVADKLVVSDQIISAKIL